MEESYVFAVVPNLIYSHLIAAMLQLVPMGEY